MSECVDGDAEVVSWISVKDCCEWIEGGTSTVLLELEDWIWLGEEGTLIISGEPPPPPRCSGESLVWS